MSTETVYTNAVIVTPEEAFTGTVLVRGSTIAAIDRGRSTLRAALDLEGDYLLPGLVDVHTDNVERHMVPRAGVRWNPRGAMLSHDAQSAAAGVTTVLDAMCLGAVGADRGREQTFEEVVAELRALVPRGLLRSEHFLHLRCEVSVGNMLDFFGRVADDPLVRMISLMDHTPGHGQYGDLDRWRASQFKRFGTSREEADAFLAERRESRARWRDHNRRAVLPRAKARGLPVASHDDRTVEEVAEGAREGITISEFPVTAEAAEAARGAGMDVIVGAPNIVRGGSHSGNVAAIELLRAGHADVIASDYVPDAMLSAAFHLFAAGEMGLPAAINLVTAIPARMVKLDDRGAIAVGKRADLVWAHLTDGVPHVRQVWRAGQRVV
ncbi:MAG: alpha-D-ribose 1-methylphosphonate 5-triphosphate diphosphatase [Alphaproteobacteria bacterium]|nr:alpha-D-ribose 1-methylphosphonate 5-triphosphate diphosphatase [Alphaproteobacteria bacterium]